ncbi:MAG: metallophosphoesterase [Campylobacterota bacterium]|nr:metallophosphoesterase [Campylobacterota bacterium]
MIEIKEGAFFISDAHYSHKRPELLELIKAIHVDKLSPTQIIFMGDIFDALFGGVDFTLQTNQEMVALINDISKKIEVIYLEGNHDFNLVKIFPHVEVFTISQQPVKCSFNNQIVYLAHGDFGSDLGYRTYTSLIRNPFVLSVLGFIDSITKHYILNNLDKYLSKKDDCAEFRGFESYISKRVENSFKCDYFVEGHFHQNKTINFDNFIYINLAAFACNQRYFIVKSLKDVELLEENIFSEEANI